jgi:superfamily II DNA/RNA helicase
MGTDDQHAPAHCNTHISDMIDELDTISEHGRGCSVEELLLSTFRHSKQKSVRPPRLLGASGTMELDRLTDWIHHGLGEKPVAIEVTDRDLRRMPRTDHVLGVVCSSTRVDVSHTLHALQGQDQLLSSTRVDVSHTLHALQGQDQLLSTLIFCTSKKTCERSARRAAQDATLMSKLKQRASSHAAVFPQAALELHSVHLELSNLLGLGICYHHRGLDRHTREVLHRLMQIGAITLCFATSTLARGVNVSFPRVVLQGIQRFDSSGG